MRVGFKVGWGGGSGSGCGIGAVGVVSVVGIEVGDIGETGAEMTGKGILEKLILKRLVSTVAKELGSVLIHSNVG